MARKQKNGNQNRAPAAAANPSTTAVTRISVGTSTSTYAHYRDARTRIEQLETENRALEAYVEAEIERSG